MKYQIETWYRFRKAFLIYNNMVECKACLKNSDASLFNDDCNNKNGLKTICKSCEKKLHDANERERKRNECNKNNQYKYKTYAEEYRRIKQSIKQIETEREGRLLKAKQEREHNLLARATT